MKALLDMDIEEEIGDRVRFMQTGYPAFGDNILIHRYVAEKALGRKLKSTEQVHHVNENKADARRVNLVICPDDAYHQLLHARLDALKDGYSPDTHQYCSDCKTYHEYSLFPKSKNRWSGYHNVCKDKNNARRRGMGYGKFTWYERLMQQYRRVHSEYTERDICWVSKEGRSL